MDFSGKNVWVTGAGKGIGYATALAFVEAGAKVTGFDQAFTQEQYPFATEVMDVADAAQVAQVCQRLLAETERLDVLVNAAGILRMGATDQLSKEDWQQTFAVNVGGAFNLFQQTMNQFRRHTRRVNRQHIFGDIQPIKTVSDQIDTDRRHHNPQRVDLFPTI